MILLNQSRSKSIAKATMFGGTSQGRSGKKPWCGEAFPFEDCCFDLSDGFIGKPRGTGGMAFQSRVSSSFLGLRTAEISAWELFEGKALWGSEGPLYLVAVPWPFSLLVCLVGHSRI